MKTIKKLTMAVVALCAALVFCTPARAATGEYYVSGGIVNYRVTESLDAKPASVYVCLLSNDAEPGEKNTTPAIPRGTTKDYSSLKITDSDGSVYVAADIVALTYNYKRGTLTGTIAITNPAQYVTGLILMGRDKNGNTFPISGVMDISEYVETARSNVKNGIKGYGNKGDSYSGEPWQKAEPHAKQDAQKKAQQDAIKARSDKKISEIKDKMKEDSENRNSEGSSGGGNSSGSSGGTGGNGSGSSGTGGAGGSGKGSNNGSSGGGDRNRGTGGGTGNGRELPPCVMGRLFGE